ncbi:MAG TPA: hypothetical protein VG841_07405 [Caulobacterales bacterium]|nr:hypothetical protein [Caulobacterales bacterium]
MIVPLVAALGVSATLALCLVRLFAGPTLYDRMLGANAAALKIAVICAALAVLAVRAEWLDTALAIVVSTFLLNAVALKFFRARTFQAPLARMGRQLGEDAT